MAQYKIREYDAKRLIVENSLIQLEYTAVLVEPHTNLQTLELEHSWLQNTQLVVKPDQLFGKRKKHGLVLINASLEEVKEFIQNNRNKEVTIGKTTDTLTHFLIEPYVEHTKEYYLSITSKREKDIILFSTEGGTNIEENWEKAVKIEIPITEGVDSLKFDDLKEVENKEIITSFIKDLYQTYISLDFAYLEINPFTISNNKIHLLDTVAQVDGYANFKNMQTWKELQFPKEFGKKSFPQEDYIKKLDHKSGASMKLTILNPQGKIWSILNGGGAGIIYLDMIANLGKGADIANSGESSGTSFDETYEYAKSIIELMMASGNAKVLFIAGGIANFTDVEKTFKGTVKALEEYTQEIKDAGIHIYVRRGGPNDTNGLQAMRDFATKSGITMTIFGPETPMPLAITAAKGDL
jgi:ATP-citrate lyase beta-subunit